MSALKYQKSGHRLNPAEGTAPAAVALAIPGTSHLSGFRNEEQERAMQPHEKLVGSQSIIVRQQAATHIIPKHYLITHNPQLALAGGRA
jgi:hypothetical protein